MKIKLIASSCAALIISTAAFAADPQPSTGHWMTTCDNTTYFYCGVDNQGTITVKGFYPATPFPVSLVASCPGGTNSISTKPTLKSSYYSYQYDGSSYGFVPLTNEPSSCSSVVKVQPSPGYGKRA